MEEAPETKPMINHIVLFPFMAQGHIIPFLALAHKIHNHNNNVKISIVNTPLNISKLNSSFPQSSHDFPIEFHQLPFNATDHGLPPHAENTDVLPYPLVIRLITAAASLKPAFANLIASLTALDGAPPACIISDIFLGWTVDVAREFNIYHAVFCGGGGFGFGCYYSVWVNTPHRKVNEKSTEFVLPDFPEAGRFHTSQLPSNQLHADGTDPWSIFQAENLPKWIESDAMLFNSVEELDSVGLAYFRRLTHKKVWPIGPVLLPAEFRRHIGKEAGITAGSCKKWLDSKVKNSVLYISFGSNNTISATHMMELAIALEMSRVNFIWVVRPPLGFDINSGFKEDEWLPEGFVKKMREDGDRGLVVHNWAPQVDILSHGSVSCFLSHCGWGSVMEALSEGVVLLGWPMAGEQFYNAKFLDEMVGVCVEVARGSRCEVRHEDVAGKIVDVMSGEKGKAMRRRVDEVRQKVWNSAREEDGSSAKAMNEFLKVTLKC